MKIEVNGEVCTVRGATVAEAMTELGWGEARVATALNGAFVPKAARAGQPLAEGDRLEILAPMQGG